MHLHSEIEEVILFGALARGDAVPGSDADLLMVLSDSSLPFLARMPAYIPASCGIGVDVFPYTRLELTRMLADKNPLVREALAMGIVLFRREGCPERGRIPRGSNAEERRFSGTESGADREAG